MKLKVETTDNQIEINGFKKINCLVKSVWLNRKVKVEMVLPDAPLNFKTGLLLLNDGQDLDKLGILSFLKQHPDHTLLNPFVTVAIHAGERKAEYGVSGFPDYLQRGANAINYEKFIVTELFALITKATGHQFNPNQTFFAGCSLGGLSAFDIAIQNQHLFTGVGIFSGSFWWRSKSYDAGYTQNDRIIFNKIKFAKLKCNFRCWLMAGTDDERNDRNRNGVIDAVDDTLDMFEFLSTKIDSDNLELTIANGGRHDAITWNQHLPDFLLYAFGNKTIQN